MNKKIKIIDLLVKIAKGEEVPNLKIKHWKQIYNFNIKMGFITCQSDEGYNLDLIQCLNDEVEILEDNTEEIEELLTIEDYECDKTDIRLNRDKINELVKAINSIRKDKNND